MSSRIDSSAEAEQGAQPVEQAWLPAGTCFAGLARGRHVQSLAPAASSINDSRIGAGNPEPAENRAFERLHRLGFGRPDMVVADQMQKAMHQKMGDVIAQRLSCLGGFPRGGLERDDDIAEERRSRRSPLVGKARTLVGLSSSTPFAVEVADESVVAEQNADFGVRGQRDAAFPDRREDRGLGKLRRGLEGRPILSFDRNVDHGIHGRRPSPLAGRAAAS